MEKVIYRVELVNTDIDIVGKEPISLSDFYLDYGDASKVLRNLSNLSKPELCKLVGRHILPSDRLKVIEYNLVISIKKL